MNNWEIKKFLGYRLERVYRFLLFIFPLSTVILIAVLILSGVRGLKLYVLAGASVVFLMVLEVIFFLDIRFKKKGLKFIEDFLSQISDVKTEEKNGSLFVSIKLNKRIEYLRIEYGKIIIYRYLQSSGKSSHVVTRYEIKEKKEKTLEFTDIIDFEIEKNTAVGFIKKSEGIIEAPGIVIHGPYRTKFLFLFSKNDVEFNIKPEYKNLILEDGARANVQFMGLKDNIFDFYVSVSNKGNSKRIKLELVWEYKFKFKKYVKTLLIGEVDKIGGYEFKYEIDRKNKIYVFPSFSVPEIDILNIPYKNSGFKLYYKISADIPLLPDKFKKSEILAV